MGAEESKVEAIFYAALERSPAAERAAYLDRACADDSELRGRVELLLGAQPNLGRFLENDGAGVAATIDQPVTEKPGATIGRYKLLEEIGEGGMGVVYMAEQREPVRRKVALKIIKPGMDTREVIARFEAERQALAMMDHPNIAHVLDGGATESGRPYFVMDLVQGIPVTKYCDQANLTTRERLALFVLVCQAVQHAHQKGIIHRDVKPSNVLVTLHDGVPVPKIIDFGVAKAIHQPLTEKSLFTGQGRMIGTPLYMSPEQAEMTSLDVDTRSDIYSLGVLLYELLTGSTPFDRERLREAGLDEVRRVIREEEPPRPSHRVSTLDAEAISTITAHRGVDARRLGRLLRGDLDWIVMKALQKDRTRRYESASALAADVERHLANEPIQARPPTLADHAAKWARRHRPVVWSAATVVLLFGFTAGSIAWNGYRRAVALEKDVSEHQAAAAALLEASDYAAAGREVVESRARLEMEGYGEGPLSQETERIADLLSAKTRSVERLDEFQRLRHRIHSEMYAVDRTILDQAQSHCRTALDLYEALQSNSWKQQWGFQDLSPERQATLEEGVVELLFIWARLEIGKSDGQTTAELQAGHRRAVDAFSRIQTFQKPISALYLWIADCWEAAGDKKAAAEARAKAEATQPTTAMDHFLLGEYHTRHGRQDQALASYWQALAQQPDHYLSLLASGVALGELKKHESAEAMLTGAIAMNPQTVLGYVKRGVSRLGQGKILLAQADFQQAKKLDPELARALIRRAEESRVNFQFDKARADYSEAIRLDPTSAAYAGRGNTYLLQGDLDTALADCNECVRLEPGSAWAYSLRAEIYRMKGDLPRALADANEGIRLDPKFARTYLCRGRIYEHRGELDKALADLNEAIHLDPKDAGLFPGRADIYLRLGEPKKALADCEEAIRLHPKNVWGYMSRAWVYREKGDFDKALADYNEAVRIAPQYFIAYILRANFHRDRGDFDKALADYKETIRANPRELWVYDALADLHLKKGDVVRAVADYSEALRLAPKEPSVYLSRARFHRGRGDFDKALADYNEATRLDPKHIRAYAERAGMYASKGELGKAAADYDRAASLGSMSWHYYKRRAAVHFQLKHYDKALESIAKAVELEPGDFSNLTWLGPAAVAKCPDERLRSGLLELADKTARWAEDTTDRSRAHSFHGYQTAAGAYVARALLYAAFGQPEKALADFNKAIELEPKNADVWAGRAHFSLQQAKWDPAIADLSKAVELKPEQTNLWYQRALARVPAGGAEDYRKDCAEMLQRFGQTEKPADAHWVAWTCALAPDATKDWPKSVALAERAVKSNPKSITYLNTLGAVLYRAGRWKDALAPLSEAAAPVKQPSEAIMSSPAYTWFFLAMAHHRLGHHEEAKKWLDKAVREADQGTADLPWNRRLTLKLLREEAEALLRPADKPPAGKEKTEKGK